MPAVITHVITVTYVNPDGTVAGNGYRIEGPLPGSGKFRRTIIPHDESDRCLRKREHMMK
jgi:hypothetical protein